MVVLIQSSVDDGTPPTKDLPVPRAGPRHRRRERLGWSLLGLTLVLLLVMVVFSAGREEAFDTVLYGLMALSLGIVGALIVSRHPDNRIGWIFSALGLWIAFVEAGEGWSYVALAQDLPGGPAGEWIISWSWLVDMGAWALVFMLFPDGRLPGRRWRAWLWILGAGVALAVTGQAFSPGLPTEFSGGANPMGTEAIPTELLLNLGLAFLLSGTLAGVTALVVRFRRGTGVERQQLKWFASAAALLVVVGTAAVFLYYESVLIQVLIALALIMLPVAAGISIFRYRLYDVDVVINRALVYAALTATLASLYVGSVLILQSAVSGLTQDSSLVVAASTLVVAGVFRPARRRIQSTVDRRFYRYKYDAERTVEEFRDRLRTETVLGSVSGELMRVVTETMQPVHTSLWLRAPKRMP